MVQFCLKNCSSIRQQSYVIFHRKTEKLCHFEDFRKKLEKMNTTKTTLRLIRKTPCSRSFWSSSDSKDLKQIYSEQRLLGYSCEQMFSVVSEVEKYHSFVPWCKKSLIKKRSPEQLEAELVVGFPPLGESYTSTVTLVEPYLVTAICKDLKMFSHLKTVWKFKPVDENKKNAQKCQLDFAVSFAFKNSSHAYFSRMFFDEVVKKNVGAFLSQAELRYGRESIPRQRPVVYALK